MGCIKPFTSPDWLMSALERAAEAGKVVDLSNPRMWGQYIHSVRENEYKSAHPDAKIEKTLPVVKPDGSIGKGKPDAYNPATNCFIDWKSNDFDKYSSMKEIIRETVKIAEQMERYRWTTDNDIPGRPRVEVRFEYTPSDPVAKGFIERFLEGRDIHVVWIHK